MKRTRKQLVFHLMLWTIVLSALLPATMIQSPFIDSRIAISISPEKIESYTVGEGATVLQDDFDATLGYNSSLWDLESYGGGSVSWVEGKYFNMSVEKHSFRALSSIQTFSAGHEAIIRMSMQEDEAVVCVGFTNTTPTTGWNYLFYNDSLYIEEAQDTSLLTRKIGIPSVRTVKIMSGFDQSEFHTYRIVWNSSVAIAYVDGIRTGVIGGGMPEGPLHFKMAITENRDQITDGWLCIDSIAIKEHNSMVDENPPFITLNSPVNGSLNLGGEPIEVVPVGSDGQLYWSWEGAANETGSGPFDITLPETEGLHTLDVYCQDGYGYDYWDHVRYTFTTMVTPPMLTAAWCGIAPTIDGVIQSREWPIQSRNVVELMGEYGIPKEVDVYLGCDNSFVYIAFDSTIPSGHDSRAAVILNGRTDGSYQGSNETPIITAYYTKGSPQAWEGYDELKYIWEESEVVKELKLEPMLGGFLSFSSEHNLNVHYEFRFPLEELGVGPGSTIGISLMLFPTGMGVHNLFYPILNPWTNASKLAHLSLPTAPDMLILQGSIIVGAIGLVAIASHIGWTRRSRSTEVLPFDSELIQRVRSIVESYDKIEVDRLSQMTHLTDKQVNEIVSYLIERNDVDAKFIGDEVVRGK